MKYLSIAGGALALLALAACGSAAATSSPTSTTGASVSSVAPMPDPTTAPAVAADTVVVTQVIDGDTIVIDSGEHIRLIGIDTPERGHCDDDTATVNMRSMVYGKAVVLVPGARDDVDQYGRLLRYVDLPDGTDTGLAQIARGVAIARYDSRDGYGHHDREEQYRAADTGAAAQCVKGASTRLPAPPPPASAAPSGGSVYYKNCAAARAAGASPLHRGDPGYRVGLDGDGDGVACE